MKWKNEICKAFDTHAPDYEEMAIAQREIGERMCERLAYLVMQPTVVLDVGCGTGYLTQRLKTRYPAAQVIGLDNAPGMLRQAVAARAVDQYLHADMMQMPIAASSVDLVVSNQVLHWAEDLSLFFKEIKRVLKPGGCVFFSTLGPDTFDELRKAWQTVDNDAHVLDFVDMHMIGDQLLAQGFLDPVMDRETLTLQYPSLSRLLKAVKAQGVRNMHAKRRSGLMAKGAWQQFEAAYTTQFLTSSGKAPLHYEILYGHAWKGQPKRVLDTQEVHIPVTRIQRGRPL